MPLLFPAWFAASAYAFRTLFRSLGFGFRHAAEELFFSCAAGLAWSAVLEPDSNGALRVTGEVESPSDRCVRIEAVATPPPGEWTWHDGIDAARPLAGGTGLVSFAAVSGFGARGLQSLLPFGLVSGPAGTLSVECDPDEPRVFEICAERPAGTLAIAFDLGLTPMTSTVPGRATFSAVSSVTDAVHPADPALDGKTLGSSLRADIEIVTTSGITPRNTSSG